MRHPRPERAAAVTCLEPIVLVGAHDKVISCGSMLAESLNAEEREELISRPRPGRALPLAAAFALFVAACGGEELVRINDGGPTAEGAQDSAESDGAPDATHCTPTCRP